MRFHQSSVGVAHQPNYNNNNNVHPSNGNVLNNNISNNINYNEVDNGHHIRNSVSKVNSLNVPPTNGYNNIDSSEIVNFCKNSFNSNINSNTNNIRNIVQYKTDSKYFNDYLKNQNSTNNNNNNIENGNGNISTEDFLEFELSEENITKFITSQTYDNCITNQSYKQQNRLDNIQRRENLIKLDLNSAYMTRNGSTYDGDNSAGCSNESTPIDDQDLVSPSTSSCADLSSPNQVELHRSFPRGIINPNYPGFQHLAHTLTEHFIDHQHFEHLSDSDISEDFEYDSYRARNLDKMNDTNNNSDNHPIQKNAGDAGDEKMDRNNTDLNSNSNKINQSLNHFYDEDSNVNLLLKSEPKVFCERKLLGLQEINLCESNISSNDNLSLMENVSSDEDDYEVDEEAGEHVEREFVENDLDNVNNQMDPTRMDELEDELVDSEDDLVIKRELENIDKMHTDQENINCNLESYLKCYENNVKCFESDFTDIEDEVKITNEMIQEDLNKLPTPDILIEHNNKMPTNSDSNKDNHLDTEIQMLDQEISSTEKENDVKNFQPDLIKNLSESVEFVEFVEEKEINQPIPPALPTLESLMQEIALNETKEQNTTMSSVINRNLSLDSASSAVDIVGDFGKEVEKEIGLIVSGYTSQKSTLLQDSPTTQVCVSQNGQGHKDSKPQHEDESVFDENKFIEHLKYFSKMGDAVLSNVDEKININKKINETCERIDAESVNELKQSKVSDCEPTNEDVLIPTAIVKPKYQKLPFDDRQLPIVGSTDDDSSWYNSSQASTITTTPRKVQKHLPNFDRRAQKTFGKQTRKIVNKSGEPNGTDIPVSEKEAINALHNYEKDIDCSLVITNVNSVAIVQPLKKDEMDLNSFDKNLNSSNIDSCKNNFMIKHENKLKNINKINNCNNTNSANYGNNLNIESENKILLKDRNFDVKKSNINVANENKKMEKKPKKDPKDNSEIFDVYNIETALPVIDLEAIESHLMAAKEEEQKRKNDREAIRRRLAMGDEDDYFTDLAAARPIRKPNLQSRLQSGMNLQICFMNEAASDTESQSSDSETCPNLSKVKNSSKSFSNNSLHRHSYSNSRNSLNNNPYNSKPLSVTKSSSLHDTSIKKERPATLSLSSSINESTEIDFFTHQARLQIEARMALSQAKDMAHMQMEIDRKNQGLSPITELIHRTLDKVGVKIPETKRRLSRQLLTGMNVAQLQIIVNELHTFIETLNEKLVKYLMERDDLHMKQDSMLVDIEDITRYLAEKEEAHSTLNKTKSQMSIASQQPRHISPKSASAKRVTRITSSSSASSGLSNCSSYSSSASTVSSMNGNSNKNQPKNLIVSGTGCGSSTITSVSNDPIINGRHGNGNGSYQTQHFNKFLRISSLVRK